MSCDKERLQVDQKSPEIQQKNKPKNRKVQFREEQAQKADTREGTPTHIMVCRRSDGQKFMVR